MSAVHSGPFACSGGDRQHEERAVSFVGNGREKGERDVGVSAAQKSSGRRPLLSYISVFLFFLCVSRERTPREKTS